MKHSVWYIASLQAGQAQPPEVTTPRVRGNEVGIPSVAPLRCDLLHAPGVVEGGVRWEAMEKAGAVARRPCPCCSTPELVPGQVMMRAEGPHLAHLTAWCWNA